MRLGKKSKVKLSFTFYLDDEYTKQFFNDIYGANIEWGNKFILDNCVSENGLKECRTLNDEYYYFLLSKYAMKYNLFFLDKENILQDGYLEECMAKKYAVYRYYRQINYEKAVKQLQDIRLRQEKRNDFFNACENLIKNTEKQNNVGYALSIVGLAGVPLSLCAVLFWKAIEKASMVKEVYNSIYG